jgi:hypothetical protein
MELKVQLKLIYSQHIDNQINIESPMKLRPSMKESPFGRNNQDL